jgi:hypothetical protein
VPRDQRAISIASGTFSVRMFDVTTTDDYPAEGVDDEAHVGDPANVGTNVGSVTHNWFGPGRGEVPLHQVPMPSRSRARLGGANPFGAPHAFDALGAHQSSDLVTTDIVPGTLGGLPQLASPLDPVVVLAQAPQRRP